MKKIFSILLIFTFVMFGLNSCLEPEIDVTPEEPEVGISIPNGVYETKDFWFEDLVYKANHIPMNGWKRHYILKEFNEEYNKWDRSTKHPVEADLIKKVRVTPEYFEFENVVEYEANDAIHNGIRIRILQQLTGVIRTIKIIRDLDREHEYLEVIEHADKTEYHCFLGWEFSFYVPK